MNQFWMFLAKINRIYYFRISYFRNIISECEEGPGVCALLMTAVSLFMILLSLPVSLIFVVKVVQVRNDQSEASIDQSEASIEVT